MRERSRRGVRGAANRPRSAAVPASLLVLLSGCARDGALAPRGPGAQRILDLFNTTTLIATVVALVTAGLLLYALFRRRRDDTEPGWSDDRFVAIGGLVVPTVILLALLGLTVGVLAQEPHEGDLTIEVTGYQFWWEVAYPGRDVVTANEIHIPVDTPVELTLRTEDVIHSFWVPQLAGKQDLVPGHDNRLIIEASEPGTYRGQCAEYCGLQHANMGLLVIAEEPAEFDRWVAAQAEPATSQVETGRDVFVEQSCIGCHAVRGLDASGNFGPDLTHVADRRTLGATTVENTPDNLRAFVENAQQIKPGVHMPAFPQLTADELDALVTYLESLE